MKKIINLLLICSVWVPLVSVQDKKHKMVKIRPCKKHATSQHHTYYHSATQKDAQAPNRSAELNHLKRRYDRGFGLQSHGDKLELDDFGYAPNNKKSYKR